MARWNGLLFSLLFTASAASAEIGKFGFSCDKQGLAKGTRAFVVSGTGNVPDSEATGLVEAKVSATLIFKMPDGRRERVRASDLKAQLAIDEAGIASLTLGERALKDLRIQMTGERIGNITLRNDLWGSAYPRGTDASERGHESRIFSSGFCQIEFLAE